MIDAVVVSRNDEALGICSFELAAADGSPLPAFSAGAHIDVHLPVGWYVSTPCAITLKNATAI